eukprot:NODE_421_length_7712_cov_1.035597.p3 type:complete len:339 gc:universal NODE_421_length_7712_cov_1.035597:4475-5491(+)
MDRILMSIPTTPNFSIHIYADDLLLVTNSYLNMQLIGNLILLKLKTHGFVANNSKFQYICSESDISHLQLQTDISIVKTNTIKYLGIYLNRYGIDYDADVKSRIDKVNFAIKKIKWTRSFLVFQSAYMRFYKGVLMPIYTYAIEAYDREGIEMLESHRSKIIRKLHCNTFRFYQFKNNYLTLQNAYWLRILRFNDQLIGLGLPSVPCQYNFKREIFLKNESEMIDFWNDQPKSLRASSFKSSHLILKLALKKNPAHIQKLFDSFLLGKLPKKSIGMKKAICIKCEREFVNLDHYENDCYLDVYLNRDAIYQILQGNSKQEIVEQLKKLQQGVVYKWVA